MDVDIRHTTADHAVDVAALLGELGYAQHPAALRLRLDVLTGAGHVVLVAVADQWVVGVVSAAALPLLAEATTLVRITALSVTRSARGLGVGRAPPLLRHGLRRRQPDRRSLHQATRSQATTMTGCGRRPVMCPGSAVPTITERPPGRRASDGDRSSALAS